jgi:hypothetical protein
MSGTFLRRCEVSVASAQLRGIPECALLDKLAPRGLPLRSPAAPPPLPSRASARAAAERVLSITRNLPGGSTSAFSRAAMRRGVCAAETCYDTAWGAAALGELRGAEAARLRGGGGGGGGSEGAASRAAPAREDFDTAGGAARAFSAEVALAWARLALNGGGGGGGEAAPTLRASLAASSAIEEELRFVNGPGDAGAAAALLPAALAHARANALRILLSAFGAEGGGGGEPPPTPAALLNLVANACDSADDVAARALGGGGDAAAGAYVPLRTALIRAGARQNVAAAHLLAAARLLRAGEGARAQGELTLAHAQLRDALSLAGGVAARAGAQRGGGGGGGGDGGGGGGGGGGGSGAWGGLAGDAALAAAALAAAVAEAELLLALSVLWGAPGGAAAAGPLFPLSGVDRPLIAPVLTRVWEGASASLRAFEALEGEGAALRSSDWGADAGLGAARPLRLLGLLNSFEGRSVTAEGAFRAVLDRADALAPFTAPSPVPPQRAAAAASARLCFAALLRQSEKRGGEAAACEEAGRAGAEAALRAWGGGGAWAAAADSSAGKKAAFLGAAAACAAAGAAHVGGWGMAMHADLAELELR